MTQSNTEERLQGIFDNVNEWLKFAEAKNFGLLTFNAAVVFGLSQTNFSSDSIVKIVGCYFYAPLALLSSLMSLLSLLPILSEIEDTDVLKGGISKVSKFIGSEEVVENIYFYGYLRTTDKANFIQVYNQKTGFALPFTGLEEDLVEQIIYNSRITWLKYQFFKIGGFLNLIGVILSPFILLVLKMIY